MDLISLANAIVLLLSMTLVAFAASVVHRFNRHFSKGEVKDLGHYVLLAMLALLLKLLTDFVVLILPSFNITNASIFQFLEIVEIAFVILTAIFLIKVALLIKKLSHMFGFHNK